MSPDDGPKILEPLLLATAITWVAPAVCTLRLWRDGRRMTATDPKARAETSRR